MQLIEVEEAVHPWDKHNFHMDIAWINVEDISRIRPSSCDWKVDCWRGGTQVFFRQSAGVTMWINGTPDDFVKRIEEVLPVQDRQPRLIRLKDNAQRQPEPN